jgi:N-acetylmuramoyl-L-alanine amidase
MFVVVALILFFLLNLGEARAETSLAWSYREGRPLLALSDLERRFGVKGYYDGKRGRLLLEGQGRTAFFLPHGSYAVIEGKFQRLSSPILPDGKGRFLVDASLLQTHLLPFVDRADREALKEEIRQAISSRDAVNCSNERPVKKIFLDPGHGGDDKGAVRYGTLEKNIVLEFSKGVARELTALGFETMLSRNRDESVPLDLRPEIAREWGADLFVSLHANTSPFPGARGAETYILSSDATDAEARKLALLENEHLRAKGSGERANLENILWDIGQTSFLQDSARLAAGIQTELFQNANLFFEKKQAKTRWKNRGVREAPFLVLSRAAMPAVLVELAYLSNVEDRVLISSTDFQLTLAKALASGIKKFAAECQERAPN